MKRTLAVIALTATALAAAPVAQADDVEMFIDILRDRGIYSKNGEGSLVSAGQEVCNGIEMGYTPMEMAEYIYENTDNSITAGDAGYIVGAAIAGLCREYAYMVEGNVA